MFKNKLWNKKCVLIVREQTACDRKAISPVRKKLKNAWIQISRNISITNTECIVHNDGVNYMIV